MKNKFNYLKLKELAEKKNLTLKEVIEQTGLIDRRFYKISSGHAQPKFNEIEKLCEFFDIDKDDFFTNIDNSENSEHFENPYKDILYKELKNENNYLKKMIEFLTDGKVKDDLVKLEVSFKTAEDDSKIIAIGTSKANLLRKSA